MVQRAAQAVGTNRSLGVVLNRAEKSGLPSNYWLLRRQVYQPGHPRPGESDGSGGSANPLVTLRREGGVAYVQ